MKRWLYYAAGPAVIMLVWFLVTRDLWQPYQVFGHSSYIDFARQVVVAHGLSLRHAFPWWVPEFYFGYGSPIFLFYAPLPYILSGLASVAGAGDVIGLKLVYIGSVLLAGVTMYRLVGSLFGRWAAVASAVLYMSAPYMLLDLYVRSSIGEVLALGLAPEVFGSLLRLSRTDRLRHVLIGAFAFAALILAHNISALFFTPFIFGFAVLLALQNFTRRFVLSSGALLVCGLLLAGFFWLPALMEKQFVFAEEGLTTGFFHFSNHFVYPSQLLSDSWGMGDSVPGPNDKMPLGIGRVHLLLILPALLFILAGKYLIRRFETFFFLMLAACGIFLTLQISRPLWEFLPLIRFIQFPWRLLALVSFGLSVTAGAVVSGFAAWRPNADRWVCLALVLAAILVYGPKTRALYVLHDMNTNQPLAVDLQTISDESSWGDNRYPPEMILDSLSIPRFGVTSTAQDDYLPRWVKEQPIEPMVKYNETVQGDIFIKPLSLRGDWFRFQIQARTSGVMRFYAFYFPGWTATIIDEPIKIYPDEPTGRILADLPQGDYEIDFRFRDTAIRHWTKIVSGSTSLALLLGSLILAALNLRRRKI